LGKVIAFIISIAAGLIPPFVFGLLWQKSKRWLVAFLFAYVLAYAVFSSSGSYVSGNHGGADNRETWYPAKCGGAYSAPSGRQRDELNSLGCFFWPLVVFDRWFIHRTKVV
jgi:hypothetical protein